MTKYLPLRINFDFGLFTEGQEVKVPVDERGTPLDQFWRDRLKDAKLDKCVTVVKTSKPKKSTSEGETK